MSSMTLIGLLFDGAQVLSENVVVISVLSVNIIGMGVLVFTGFFANRANSAWRMDGVALMSTGLCTFVLVSYVIVVISGIRYLALSILSNGLLVLSLLACVAGLLYLIKKKHPSVN